MPLVIFSSPNIHFMNLEIVGWDSHLSRLLATRAVLVFNSDGLPMFISLVMFILRRLEW